MFGPYHRVAQRDATTSAQLDSGEIWGRPNRGSDIPSVDAWIGRLPSGKPGVEFYTDVAPDEGLPPGRARWIGPRDGVRVEGEFAKIRCTIVAHRFEESP